MRILLIIISSLTFLFPGPLRSDNWSMGIISLYSLNNNAPDESSSDILEL